MPIDMHLIAVPAAVCSLHRGIAEAQRHCTYGGGSASAHLAGRERLLARVQPVLDLVPNWRDLVNSAPDGAAAQATRVPARSGPPPGDGAVLDREEER